MRLSLPLLSCLLLLTCCFEAKADTIDHFTLDAAYNGVVAETTFTYVEGPVPTSNFSVPVTIESDPTLTGVMSVDEGNFYFHLFLYQSGQFVLGYVGVSPYFGTVVTGSDGVSTYTFPSQTTGFLDPDLVLQYGGPVESLVGLDYMVLNITQDSFAPPPISPVVPPPPLTAVTPEPCSITLLGTGLLGLVGVMRRRYCAAG